VRDQAENSVKALDYFNQFEKLPLRQNMRVGPGEGDFAKELNEIGTGRANIPGTLHLKLHEKWVAKDMEVSKKFIINSRSLI
jgi:hypothetical protein